MSSNRVIVNKSAEIRKALAVLPPGASNGEVRNHLDKKGIMVKSADICNVRKYDEDKAARAQAQKVPQPAPGSPNGKSEEAPALVSEENCSATITEIVRQTKQLIGLVGGKGELKELIDVL